MNIYVGNLPLDIAEDELKQLFAGYGQVNSVRIMNDRYIGSGQTRIYGYVEMASHVDGREAISQLDGKVLHNRLINVVEALPLSNISGNTEKKDSRWNKRPRQRV